MQPAKVFARSPGLNAGVLHIRHGSILAFDQRAQRLAGYQGLASNVDGVEFLRIDELVKFGVPDAKLFASFFARISKFRHFVDSVTALLDCGGS